MSSREFLSRPVHPALPVIAAAATYGALFPLAYDALGPAATTLVLVPVATIAWLTGTAAGIVAAVLSIPVNLLLLAFAGVYGLAPLLQAVLPVFAGMAYLAGTIGWLRALPANRDGGQARHRGKGGAGRDWTGRQLVD